MSLVCAQGVSKRFGATQALDSIDLEVKPGEVVALLGENGAGKSTLSNIIAGTFAPDTGTMTWQGQPYAPAEPGDAIAAGHRDDPPGAAAAAGPVRGRERLHRPLADDGRARRPREMNARAAEQLQRLGLDISPTRLVRTLRVAAQQQVEIAKALTLDAQAAAPRRADRGARRRGDRAPVRGIDQLRAEGVSFIYVSHRLEEIARIADRVVVLRDGRWVASHDSAQVPVVTADRGHGRAQPRAAVPGHGRAGRRRGAAGRRADRRRASATCRSSVRAGEILGIAGIVGAGRTELVRAIAGADPVTAGTVSVEGKPLRLGDPAAAIAAGVALVPEDRKAQGIVLDLPIGDNIAISNLDRLAEGGWVKPAPGARGRRVGDRQAEGQGRARAAVRALSGGNQQKVVIAKWLERQPQGDHPRRADARYRHGRPRGDLRGDRRAGPRPAWR